MTINSIKLIRTKREQKYKIICLWFSYLPVEIAFSHLTTFKRNAFAITSRDKNKQILYSINPFGEFSGLKLGMNLLPEEMQHEFAELVMNMFEKELGELLERAL